MACQVSACYACLLLLVGSAAYAQEHTPGEALPGVTTFKVGMDVRVVPGKEYGTLEFHGHVERIDSGDSYEFRPRIRITFRPGEFRNGYIVTNRTRVADLRWCALVATIFHKDTKQHEVLHRERLPITIRLSKEGETKSLPDLSFRLLKSISDRASHVGITVSDGYLLWPISTELK